MFFDYQMNEEQKKNNCYTFLIKQILKLWSTKSKAKRDKLEELF